ncbi:unnamed protein product [Orchesella dallaii]|uniref:SH2 domain-containing protein n=1 Tax=Orchesella dallaii TaxID=48710 RepID=A0ABP1Q462_9HEXA
MPSLVEKMQPWTHSTHSILPTNLLRRSWSSSSANSATSPQSTTSSTASLLTEGGSGPGISNSGTSGSRSNSNNSCSSTSNTNNARVGGGTGSGNSHHQSLFSKICSGGSSSNSNNNNSTSNNSNGSRPKRKTPILSTCMSNWVKFDHDCQKPLHCAECESNQERNRKVLFSSGGNVLISSGGKGKHHRHSSLLNHHRSHHHNHLAPASMSEPTSPTSGGSSSSASSSSNNAFSGEVVSWENVRNKSSFKIVINVPYLDMSLFQNDNIQVEIVCNKNKMATGKDFEIVQRNRTELRNSGWYWEGIDSEASMEILESAVPGAFIIRDSADPRFLYSLSVQTERGPTSVRLTYRNGRFSLDADEKLAEVLPKFDSVIRLIEHYVNGGTKVGKQVWVDPRGNMHSTVKLTKPMRKDVGSLKHLTRVAINRHNLQPTKVSNSNASSSTSNTFPKTTLPAASVSSVVNSATTPTKTTSEYKNVSAAPVNHACGKDDGTSGVIPTVADLKLPLSLQKFMQEYPYNL